MKLSNFSETTKLSALAILFIFLISTFLENNFFKERTSKKEPQEFLISKVNKNQKKKNAISSDRDLREEKDTSYLYE